MMNSSSTSHQMWSWGKDSLKFTKGLTRHEEIVMSTGGKIGLDGCCQQMGSCHKSLRSSSPGGEIHDSLKYYVIK